MTTTPGAEPRLYQDTWKKTYASLDELARDYMVHTPPRIGDSLCPAAQYTFAVSEDGGKTWRNPTQEEQQDRIDAAAATGQCCQKLDQGCWARENAR